jgi:hypothetical protein
MTPTVLPSRTPGLSGLARTLRHWSLLALLPLAPMTPLMPPIPTVPIDRVGTVIGPPGTLAAAHRFGVSVAIDETRLVVGADGRRDGPPERGSVVIFERTQAPLPRWRLKRVLQAPAGDGGDAFGAAIALDGSRLVVGAPDADDRRGAVWLIDLDDAEAVPERLPIPDPVPGDQIGECVAISGDLVVIGAPRANHDGFLDRGRVWTVRLEVGSDLRAVVELEPPVSLTGLRFGSAIALGDSIAVGSPGADVPADPSTPEELVDRAGEIIVFSRALPFTRLDANHRSTPGPLDRLGSATVWNDGVLIAGSPRADCGTGRGGIITVFGRPPSERSHPCRPEGGLGGRLSCGAGRLASAVPGRRGPDGRLDGSVMVGDVDAAGFTPALELISIGRGPLLLDLAVAPSGDRLAVGAARDHEDASAPGLVWVVEFGPTPVAAAADQDGPSSDG